MSRLIFAFSTAVANPMETLQWAKEKLGHLELPEGMEITDLLNMAHGQLEAMGIPSDPEKIKEMLGLEGLNMEDLSKSSYVNRKSSANSMVV